MEKVKVTMNLDQDIHNFAKEYAKKKRVSVSHLVNQYFMKLKINEHKEVK